MNTNNTKRIFFWVGFVVVLGLIIWGLIVAVDKGSNRKELAYTPKDVILTDHITGSESAPVTIIEYSDFQCPACALFYPIVERLLKEMPDKVKLVYRHFPLPQHSNAINAAVASEASSLQGKFWEMYSKLFQGQSDWENKSDKDAEAIFIGYAEEIGLNKEQFIKDLKNTTLKDRVDEDLKDGIKIGINSTPTFFVNGKAITNPRSYEEFKTIIEDAIKTNTK
jgi:protein-disulfide isomerase